VQGLIMRATLSAAACFRLSWTLLADTELGSRSRWCMQIGVSSQLGADA